MKEKLLLFSLLSLIVIMLYSCDEEPEVNTAIYLNSTEQIILKQGETSQIDIDSELSITYTSGNEYYASVSNTGLVSGVYVGETNIEITNGVRSKNVTVVVKPEYDFFDEPCIEWGMSQEDYINKYGEPRYTGTRYITYNYDGTVITAPDVNYTTTINRLIVLFDDYKLRACIIEFSLIQTILYDSFISEMSNFLDERYVKEIPCRDYYRTSSNGLTSLTTTTNIHLYQESSSFYLTYCAHGDYIDL